MRVEQATAKVAPTQGGRCGACRRRGEGTPPYGGVGCLRRVVGDADPYDIGKTPVGRGQRAPPLRVLCVVSAAHTQAPPYGCITRGTVRVKRAAARVAPTHNRRIFIKMSFRGAKRRGNPFPRVTWVQCAENTDLHTGDVGHWFAMTGYLRGVCRADGTKKPFAMTRDHSKGLFYCWTAYLTSSMMAVSAASPRRTPVRMMRV